MAFALGLHSSIAVLNIWIGTRWKRQGKERDTDHAASHNGGYVSSGMPVSTHSFQLLSCSETSRQADFSFLSLVR
ncbi:unnamed protein product [Caretta caretta]